MLKKIHPVTLKRQQTTRMYFVTLLFLPILKPGSAWPCQGCTSLPGWWQGACMRSCWLWCRKFCSFCTTQRSDQKKSICSDQLCIYHKIFCTSKVFWGKRGCKVNLVPGTNVQLISKCDDSEKCSLKPFWSN